MNSNELTFNELSAADILANDWGTIDISAYVAARDDEEVCFKLNVWLLQVKFKNLVKDYVNSLVYGVSSAIKASELLTFKRGLQILNKYNPRDIDGDTTLYNVLTYSRILKILQILSKKY